MIVYGFVGPSGTGKSALALTLCHRLNIYDFIDDGLYIHNGTKVAGVSAKYEHTTFAAVKRAIFYHPHHREEVKEAIAKNRPGRLLILGTSQRMIHRIADALALTTPKEWIDIRDISTPSHIEKALLSRQMNGQHVIPIPRIQVENDRFHQLIEKVRAIFDTESKKPIGETTIVHPRFRGGRIEIKKSCLDQMIRHSLKQDKQVHAVGGIEIPIDLFHPLTVNLSLYDDLPIPEVCQAVQNNITAIFQQMLNISIPSPNIYVYRLEIGRQSVKSPVIGWPVTVAEIERL